MQYQYTEEHYAEMYNNLPDGLKDLVLSGRLAIKVSAIGARHALSADQIADLEPAIEDVCLGLITEDELVENIKVAIGVDNRVAMRIAADAGNDILKEYEDELKTARLQKLELDQKIRKQSGGMPLTSGGTPAAENLPKDVSEHPEEKTEKVVDWYSRNDLNAGAKVQTTADKKEFDWEETLSKKKVHTPLPSESLETGEKDKHELAAKFKSHADVEEKLATLTESINKLVNMRFGDAVTHPQTPSPQIQELIARLEKAEKENAENRRIIREMQGIKPLDNIFGEKISTDSINSSEMYVPQGSQKANSIPIDKERKVSIDKKFQPENTPNGPIQVQAISRSVPINKSSLPEQLPNPSTSLHTEPVVAPVTPVQNSFSSTISKGTVDAIVEMKQATPIQGSQNQTTAPKNIFSPGELFGGDDKIKTAQSAGSSIPVEPSKISNSIPVKNIAHDAGTRDVLLKDLEALGVTKKVGDVAVPNTAATSTLQQNKIGEVNKTVISATPGSVLQVVEDINSATKTMSPTRKLEDETVPQTKEERMQKLLDKIKSMNKGVSTGGSTNISASTAGADPYRL